MRPRSYRCYTFAYRSHRRQAVATMPPRRMLLSGVHVATVLAFNGKMLRFAIPCASIVAADQFTKLLVRQRIRLGSEGFSALHGHFRIVHSQNTGLAFGLLQTLP